MSQYRQGSPNQDRISKIYEKLSTIQVSSETDKNSKLDQSENRSRVLEENFSEFEEVLAKRIVGLRDQIGKMQKMVEAERREREVVFELKQKEIVGLDEKLNALVDQEIQRRQDGQQKLVRAIDDKVQLIRNEIQREEQLRNESIEQLNSCLESDIPKLSEGIKAEGQEREETDQQIMKQASEELLKLSQQAASERRQREESEQQIFDMLKDVVNQVKGEIDTERKNRENTEEVLLGLLEDTCSKLNTASLA